MMLTSAQLWAFLAAMRVAAQQCVQIGRALQPLVSPEHKAPDSPHQTSTTVTLADRLLQEVLILRALEMVPTLRIYSEELDTCPDELCSLFANNTGRYVLVLDPIDGSDDYAAGRNTWGVMIGLLDAEAQQMVASLIHLAADHSTWCAVLGDGARSAVGLDAALCPMNPPQVPHSLGRTKRLSGHDYAAAKGIGVALVDASSRSCAVEQARLLRGEIGAVAMRHFHGHDSAMGALIAQELGGMAVDATGTGLSYAPDMPRLPLVVISLDAALAHSLAAALSQEANHEA